MEMFLETERLILRRFPEEDMDNHFELDSDPEVMRYLTGGKQTPRAVIRDEVLPGFLRDYERFDGLGTWAVVEKSTGDFLGWFGLRPSKDDRGEVELGHRLRRSAWGKGYATEGSRTLIQKGFTELDVQRVFAQTMAVNLSSRRVMEKSGLTFVRTFHLEWDEPVAGAGHGEVEYALTRADWERRKEHRTGT
ncbi:MAG: GNAT family N-acetyltransferase [Rubrobacter sp.]|nr:GNAT family N-acetyltransferase [Rubrobacter sp.]